MNTVEQQWVVRRYEGVPSGTFNIPYQDNRYLVLQYRQREPIPAVWQYGQDGAAGTTTKMGPWIDVPIVEAE